MIIRYASDLHLEFGMNSRYLRSHPLAEVGDVLLLAGDVAYLENRRLEKDPFFDWCAEHFRETVIVPGNHEYYRDPVAREGRQDGVPVESTLVDYEHKVRENVRYLNNRSMVFGDVEVFATTLWTVARPVDYVAIQNGMSDCHQILYRGHRLWADEFTELHGVCRSWLYGALEKSAARHKVVLTHHCPVTDPAFDRYSPSSALYSAFHVDMARFIGEHDVDAWIYGHTHCNGGSGTAFPSKKGEGTLLLCSQLGYLSCGEERGGFDAGAVLKV